MMFQEHCNCSLQWLKKFNYIAEKAGDPNINDYREKIKMKRGKLIKELKQGKPGNAG